MVLAVLVTMTACDPAAGVSQPDGSSGGDSISGDAGVGGGGGDQELGPGEFLTDSYGGREYRLFVPGQASLGVPLPLIVMLHGCAQDPEDIAAGSQMNELAADEGAFVLYPAQPVTANLQRCWNWFDSTNQSRDSGEPALVVGMLEAVRAAYVVDGEAIYAAGISAGGAMAVILGATYPELFAGLGVVAGLEYQAAVSAMDALGAMTNGGPPPDDQGQAAFDAMGSNSRMVPVIVFHGTTDPTVAPVNGDQVISQWAQTNDLAADGNDDDNVDDTPEETSGETTAAGVTYAITRYHDDVDDRLVLEKVVIIDGPHAWPGGDAAGSFTDPDGPDATAMMWAFFAASAP